MVWKSDTDSRLFEDKGKYVAHLRKLAANRLFKRKLAKADAEREVFFKRMGNEVKSFAELEQFICDNWDQFFYNAVRQDPFSKRKPKTKHKLVGVTIVGNWSEKIRNSHNCPRNGVTNWSRSDAKPGTPESYPGWTGNISFTVDAGHTDNTPPRPINGYGGDYFRYSTIHTGSGGGGSNRWSYGVELFADDFPAMREARDRAITWNKLSNQQLEAA